MILVSQQFLIFKKYNSQETIFILELTWLKNTLVFWKYVTYEMYCQFINFSFNMKRKQKQINNENSHDFVDRLKSLELINFFY